MQEAYFRKRPKVTNARAGQSAHNYYPSRAFDIAFVKVGKRELDYAPKHFKEFWDILQQHSNKLTCNSMTRGTRYTNGTEVITFVKIDFIAIGGRKIDHVYFRRKDKVDLIMPLLEWNIKGKFEWLITN